MLFYYFQLPALLLDLNQRAFKKLSGNRTSACAEPDRPVLRPLRATRMPSTRFKSVRVNIDYFVELNGLYYSVPRALVDEPIELRIKAGTIESPAWRQTGGRPRPQSPPG